jgi:type I restriction enzyme R subunit
VLFRVILSMMKDETNLFKQFSDNEVFRRWLSDTVFNLIYPPDASETLEQDGEL